MIVLWGVGPGAPWSSWPWEISPSRRDELQWDGEELVEGFFRPPAFAQTVSRLCYVLMLSFCSFHLKVAFKRA